MKKTLIALLALSSVTMAAETFSFDVEKDLLTSEITSCSINKGSASWSALDWAGLRGGNTTNILNDFKNVSDFAAPGLHTFLSDGTATTNNLTFDEANHAVTLTKGSAGTAISYVYSVGDEKAANSALTLNSLSFSVTTGTTANDCYYTVYKFSTGADGNITATCLQSINSGKINPSSTITYEVNTTGLVDTDKILFMVREGTNTAVLNELSFTANYSKENAPEPTTGALSLLALAGMVARRRRK